VLKRSCPDEVRHGTDAAHGAQRHRGGTGDWCEAGMRIVRDRIVWSVCRTGGVAGVVSIRGEVGLRARRRVSCAQSCIKAERARGAMGYIAPIRYFVSGVDRQGESVDHAACGVGMFREGCGRGLRWESA